MIKEEFWNTKLDSLLRPKFYLYEIPKFQCPHCSLGLLITDSNKFISESTEESLKCFNIIGEIEVWRKHFTTITRCNNPDCREITTISGLSNVVQTGWEEEEYDYELKQTFPHTPTYGDAYDIKYVNPCIRLIHIPQDIDSNIERTLNKSFSLFWNDEDACANKIRITIEQLLNFHNVPTTTINKEKVVHLTLHERIKIFSKNNSKLQNLLLAVKWVGNEGSHFDQLSLERQDLVNAYKIIDLIFRDFFDTTRTEIHQLAQAINMNRGSKVKKK